MPIYWVVLLIICIGSGILGLISQRAEESSSTAGASTIASNMLVYRNALAEYARSNQTTTGTVQDTALALPSWYAHAPGVSGYVVSGLSYTYYLSPSEGLVAELVKMTDASVAVGYVQAGRLISPIVGATGITVPSVIPSGAAIAVQ
ncbi:type IV pilus biogenesis protein PilM [Pseudomonas phytophila]|uniref:Type IV pilus biogenesis protein PilM n=1 Tax=Pseudomonas phytophila TaxID=2867264 RepID=A0ABY6FH71_9PSED|nr:type IV pilus biogenesis protein PilM [Pseudomonas phytophila]UXZ97256.1 type IV pilus biogenesis protein PilM [Pseudomonas phytophila]